MGRMVGIVVLLAVITGAWWLVRDEVRRDPAHGVRAESIAPGAVPGRADNLAGVELATPDARVESDPPSSSAARVPAQVRTAPSELDVFRVRVLCTDGTPLADVRVSLEPDDDHAVEPLLATTDPAGRAGFSGARARIASSTGAWTLSHDLPALEPPSQVLGPAALGSDEFDSVLPPGGRIEVLVRELDGTPAPQGSELRLRLADRESGEWRRAAADGRVLFPWVELGREWELAAWRPQGSAPARARVHGPTLPGQTVQVQLVLGVDHSVVSFRAVDPSGRPLPSVPLDLAHRRSFGQVARSQVETDAQGRFLVDGANTLFDAGRFVVSYLPEDGALHQGRARLPESPRNGWNDGGDVVLEPSPLLCAGIVLDPDGRGVAGADVVAGPDHAWMGNDSQVRGRSAADGRFELRGMWDSDEFELRATKEGMRSETIHVRQGQQGVALELAPRHSLSGTLGVEAGIRVDALRFQLRPLEGKSFEVGRRSDPFSGLPGMRGLIVSQTDSDSAEFELEPVPGGVYSLVVLLEGSELARTSTFALNQDLHLGTIDLRGRIRTSEIRLLGAGDPGALRGKATWSVSGSSARHDLEFEGDRVRIQAPALPIDVTLLVSGHRAVRLEGVAERAEVTLEPTVPVRVVLLTSGQLPSAPLAFGCDLHQDGLTVGEPRGARSFDPQDPVMVFDCAAVGEVEVRWHLERSFEGAGFGGAVGGGVLDGHAVEIEVRDEDAEQVFTIRLDGALLDELMRSPPW